MPVGGKVAGSLIGRFASKLKYPQLFFVTLTLFLIDLVVPVGELVPTAYDFTITWNGSDPVWIYDVVPAEWDVTHVEFDDSAFADALVAAGKAAIPMARAAVAAGADGLIIEAHPQPGWEADDLGIRRPAPLHL